VRVPGNLKLKLKYDPEERFQSEWYRYYKTMFSGWMSKFIQGKDFK